MSEFIKYTASKRRKQQAADKWPDIRLGAHRIQQGWHTEAAAGLLVQKHKAELRG